ncbi:uncharacterized membrane protein YcaP (DUF421 family) [Sagittula marina]|uniref:Uncharacterized membrane protein YcaP (DUF421 family) n=1 Tax=Sagittula marina TaxID=943940 RepID=A0A7W6GSK8_9RHOB|nr:YetF domain-containing protein [Sagittula marina]MBB3985683.1 uncharacterized membrane protein YcaP (DUF421 family) [Sagittula marina]
MDILSLISDMLYQGWQDIFRTVFVGVLGYAALITMLRISGKRTLAKLNAFDLVVTVAIGSVLATILLSEDVALAEGIAALFTLIGLQWALARASMASDTLARVVRSEPRLLMHKGEILHQALHDERILKNELMTVIRSAAPADPDKVTAVILETDGSFSVIGHGADGEPVNFARAGLNVAQTGR